MIELSSVSFTYAGMTAPALHQVSLSIKQGALLCLCGANGSGKSTLLLLLAGLFAPASGTVTLKGHSPYGGTRGMREQAALVLQDADLQILGATVEEDLQLTLPRGKDSHDAAFAMARRFGLAECWENPVQTLSYGQKRKLCLAAAALRRPALLLLDEPFNGLDYPAVQELRALLRANVTAGLTQVVSVHDMEPVLDLSDAVAVLHEGVLVSHGVPEKVLNSADRYGLRVPCSWRYKRRIEPWD